MKKHDLFATLEKTHKDAIELVSKGLENFPWEDEEAYCKWLAQTFYTVQHTTRFVCLAAANFTVEYQKYHQFCIHHLKEEVGHELLAKKDIESLGHDLKDFPPTVEAEAMIQSQYYWINQTPFSHFGFFWLLEALSFLAGPAIIARVHKAHGKDCTTFLDLHAFEDVEHVKTVTKVIESFPEHALPSLIANISQTGFLYTNMLETIKKSAGKKLPKAA